MRLVVLLICLFFVISCRQELAIEGKWKTTSKFYQATYKVYDKYIQTLSYNDGTNRYKYGNSEKKFFAKNLIQKDKFIVDAVAGATNSANPPVKIEIINSDSLKVTTTMAVKPIIEYWTKIK